MKKSLSFSKAIIFIAVVLAVGLVAYFFSLSKTQATPDQDNINPANITPQNINPLGTIFGDYYAWPSSTRLKPGQTMMQMIEMMTPSRTHQKENFVIASQYLDFNGDGLTDFLHFFYSPYKECGSTGYRGYMAMKNKGDYTFETVYKCMWESRAQTCSGNPEHHTFYGDCAALTEPYEEEFYVCSYCLPNQGETFFSPVSMHPLFFFHDCSQWLANGLKNPPDIGKLLSSLTTVDPWGFTQDQPKYERGSQFVDLNGDGLMDLLFLQRGETEGEQKTALINQGNFSFSPIYISGCQPR